MRKDEDYVERRTKNMEVEEHGRGKLKLEWRDKWRDMQEKGLREKQTRDRAVWRRLVRNSDPIYRNRNNEKEY